MPKILVVDDNEDMRELLSRALMQKGFDVVTCGDGTHAIKMVEEDTPDLVLMDMNMPGLDGLEATKQIKLNEATASLPVIALTAYALDGDRERAIEAGADDYHTKPVDFPRLLEQIEIVFRNCQTTAESVLPEDLSHGQ